MICAVHGPHAQSGRDASFNEQGKIQCEYSYAPFARRGLPRESRGGKGDDERELSTLLRQTLEASVQVRTAPASEGRRIAAPRALRRGGTLGTHDGVGGTEGVALPVERLRVAL